MDLAVRAASWDRMFACKSAYRYPDAMVAYSDTLSDTTVQVSTPILIVEALSDSTELTDRREKLAEYESIPSLAEYLLVAAQRRAGERFRRTAEGLWVHERYGPGDELVLDAIGLTLPVAALYVDTEV